MSRVTKFRRRRRVVEPKAKPKPKVRRQVAAGLLQPQQSIVIVLDPPMKPNEQPVALTPNAGDILLKDATEDRVTIANQTDRIIGYLLVIVPSIAVKVAMVPWRRVANDLGKALRDSGTLDRLARLFGDTKISSS